MKGHNDGLPEDGAAMILMVHALVDGELDAAAALAVERRIAADATLAAEHRRILAVRAAVARLPGPEPGPAFLARIAAIGSGAEAGPAGPRPVPASQAEATSSRAPERRARTAWSFGDLGSFDWRAMAASVVLTAALASGATQWVMREGAADRFALAVASGHRRSLLAANPVDVLSSNRHTVRPWLDARIGLSPPAPDLSADGFVLVGGRVEVIADRPLPALVYRHNEHLITVVAEPRSGGAVTGPADLSAGGFALVRWGDAAFGYWAISDMERPELDDFVARFRAAAAAI